MKTLVLSLIGPALFAALYSPSAQAGAKVLLSVGDETSFSAPEDKEFRHQLCENYLVPLAREAALRNLETDLTSADCLDSSDPTLPDLIARGGDSGYSFHIGLQRLKNSNYVLEIHHWSRRDQDLPMYAHWTFEPKVIVLRVPDDAQRIGIERTIARFFRTPSEEAQLVDQVLNSGVQSVQGSVAVTDEGKYYDRNSGRQLTVGEAWDTFRAEDPKQQHFGRAALELAMYLGYGVQKYYRQGGAFPADRYTNSYFQGVFSKFTSTRLWRFDNNGIRDNFGHTFAGVFPYQIGRSEGYGPLKSTLFSLAQSLTWETFVEAREVTSIWDNFATGWSGAIVGEDMVQISNVWARVEHPNPFTKFVSGLFNIPGVGNRLINKESLPKAESFDKHGFPDDVWHQFDAYARLGDKPGDTTLGIDQQVVDLVDYQRPCEDGKECKGESRWVKGTPYARFLVESGFGGGDTSKYFKLFTQTALAAYYSQKLHADAKGRLAGYSFYIAPSSAFEFNDERGLINGSTSSAYWADIHVIGSRMEVNMYFKGYHLKMDMDVFADLAQIRSLEYSNWASDHNAEGVKSSLINWQNYYGFGLTYRSEVEVSKGRVIVSANQQTTKLHSIQGLDQDQEKITNDFSLTDTRFDARGYVGVRVWKNMEIQGGVRYREFTGNLLDFSAVHREFVPSLGVNFKF